MSSDVVGFPSILAGQTEAKIGTHNVRRQFDALGR